MSGDPLITAQPLGRGAAEKTAALWELVKAHLSLYIALSAVFGYLLAAGRPHRASLLLGACVWLLAAGASAANNIQDRHYDRGFARTRNRCLPQKRVGLAAASCLAVLGTGAGLAGLWHFFESHLPWMLGVAGLFCYNGLYTPLKKTTLWAYGPGIVCGMLPPAIGWTAVPGTAAAGGFSYLGPVMLMLGLWQVPHFLILELKQGNPSGPARCPGIGSRLSDAGLKYQIKIWTCLYSLSVLLFLIRGGMTSSFLSVLTAANAVIIPVMISLLVRETASRRWAGLGFGLLNLSILGVMAFAILDRVIAGYL